jgi:hypothetical protein
MTDYVDKQQNRRRELTLPGPSTLKNLSYFYFSPTIPEHSTEAFFPDSSDVFQKGASTKPIVQCNTPEPDKVALIEARSPASKYTVLEAGSCQK